MKKEYINEIWKPIKGYEELYEVSNYGRIRSFDRWCSHRRGKQLKKGKILKLHKDTSGYLCVKLCKNTNQYQFKVHRLVAQTFIPNPNNLPQVNHKDECKTNNIVSNLEWCDIKYNVNYCSRNKIVAEKLSKIVLQYDLEGNFIKEYKSVIEASKMNFNKSHIAACCRGERKTHKGFIWRYK